jgi:hypothetical protein
MLKTATIIDLSDLAAVRVTCKRCKAAVDYSIPQLRSDKPVATEDEVDESNNPKACACCKETYRPGEERKQPSTLRAFADALNQLNLLKNMSIELVLLDGLLDTTLVPTKKGE